MSDMYILDDNGTPVPCDTATWGRWMQDSPLRFVKQEFVTVPPHESVRVSTVFLGVDHNFGGRGAPVLWESMVFGGPMDQEQRRYASQADAIVGHELLVCDVRLAAENPRGVGGPS